MDPGDLSPSIPDISPAPVLLRWPSIEFLFAARAQTVIRLD